MRYQSNSSSLVETVAVAANFPTGDVGVTVAVYNMVTGGSVTLTSNAATEIGTTGIYVWLTSNITTQPTTFTQYVVIFTNTAGTTAAQKIVKGGYPDQIAITTFEGAVHIDTVNGSAGTAFPLGTPVSPVNNEADARTIANTMGLKVFHIRGSITLTQAYNYWSFIGQTAALNDTVALGGQNVNNSKFENLTVSGIMGGTVSKNVTFTNVRASAVSGFDGVMTDCAILTSLGMAASGSGLFKDTKFVTLFGTFNANGCASVQWSGVAGLFTITNWNLAGSLLLMQAESAEVTMASSCNAGSYAIGGHGTLVNSGTMLELRNEFRNIAVDTQIVVDGLDAQGYTSVRAANLDNLDTRVSNGSISNAIGLVDASSVAYGLVDVSSAAYGLVEE